MSETLTGTMDGGANLTVTVTLDSIVISGTLNTVVAHTHTKSDISDFNDADYASAAQGAKADAAISLTGSVSNGQIAIFDGTNWVPTSYTPGVSAHSGLSGLDNDDHTQYFNQVRGDARYALLTDARLTDARTPLAHNHTESQISDLDKYTQAEVNNLLTAKVATTDPRLSDARNPTAHSHTLAEITDFNAGDYATAAQGTLAASALQTVSLGQITDVDLSGAAAGQALVFNGTTWTPVLITGGGGGTTDHGALSGLGDDDHTQYHTDARGDARYYTKTQSNGIYAGVNHIHTKSQISDFDDADYAPAVHTHTKSEITDFMDSDYATAAQGALASSALQSVTLESATDVDTAGKTDGQVLAWNNANGSWEAVDPAAGTAFNGGTVTENIQIDKADANMIVDASTGTPRFQQSRDGVKTFEIQGLQTRALLRRFHETGGGQNRFEMYDDSTRFDHEVRGTSTVAGSNALAFVTKDYVDANINGAFNGGTITENLNIEKANAKFEITATGDTNPTFNMWYGADVVQQMYYIPGTAGNDHIRWVKNGGPNNTVQNTLRLYADYAYFESDIDMRNLAAAGEAKRLKMYEAVANGVNYVATKAPEAVASTYTIVYPTSPGTVGQQLQIGSISGTELNMVWV